ncbi:MAG TPA: BatA and WFA domain-containing protein [Phycisphaerales bacterium]|nr:BatA and WFA domain-containing protein [Phycisphaerales bacterium]
MNWLRETFLTPAAGFYLALAVIPPLVLLYFLRLRRKPQAISTTLLWQQAIEDLRANAPFQRLRKSILLFLQLLALILLAIAIMQPQLRSSAQKGGKRVIMIDNSASMTATDGKDASGKVSGEVTRLEEAKQHARDLIEDIYRGGIFSSQAGETMVVSFSEQAEILQRFTDSKSQLLAAIDRIEPTHGETSLHEALKLARAYTANKLSPTGEFVPNTEDPPGIELYTDGRIKNLDQEVSRETIHFVPIGSTSVDNVGISAISVDRPFDRPTSVAVFAGLVNFNSEEIACDIQLSVNGTARGIQETKVPGATINPSTNELVPGRANVVFVPFEQPQDAVIEVANLRKDILLADNVVHTVIPAPKQLSVGLVSQDFKTSLVARALEGMALRSLVPMSPADFDARVAQGTTDAFDVVVFDNCKAATLPAGRYLTFGPTPPVPGLTEYGEADGQVVLNTKDESPAMRFVSMDSVFVAHMHSVQAGDQVEVLAEGSTGPLILSVSTGSIHCIHVTFDPLDSNWVYQRSFLIFIMNSVETLGRAGEPLTEQGYKCGDAFTARIPANATNVSIQSPDGKNNPVSVTESGQAVWGPIPISGLYTMTWNTPDSGAKSSRTFAVNLVSMTEGRVDVAPELKLGNETVTGDATAAHHYVSLWPWAIALCVALLMVEWWIYHRKLYL